MRVSAIGMVGLLVLAGFSVQKAANSSVRNGNIFTGEITDSLCAEDGHNTGVIRDAKNTSKADCTLTCVKLSGAQFVLYDPQTNLTYKLDDQKQPEAFAGDKVAVAGTYDAKAKTIHVTNIWPVWPMPVNAR